MSAVVLCNETIKSTLINYARGVIFTTAPSFVTAAAVRAGQELVAGDEGERVSGAPNKLHNVIN